jgi:flagellar M-ring protein FliF
MEFLRGIFGRIRGWFAGIWEKTEKRDRTRFVVISGVAVFLLIAAIVVLNNNRYTELHRTSNPLEMRAITDVLTENNISFRPSGDVILVNKNNYTDAYTALLMRSDVNLDPDLSIYALGTGLTSTAADRQQYTVFQIQSDLRRTFENMPMVDHASVLIHRPDNRGAIFSGEVEPSTASVGLWLNSEISESQARKFVEFVAGATGVAEDDIRITDQYMRDLIPRQPEGSVSSLYEAHYQHKLRVEKDLASAASRMLSQLFGPMNVSVEAYATLDFDVRTTESIIFYPVVDDEGIIRSMQSLAEDAQGLNFPGGFPGTDENGLGDEYVEILDQWRSIWKRTQDTVNYDVSQVNEYVDSAQGKLTDLTIAVSINSDILEDADMNVPVIQQLVGASVGLLPAEHAGRVVVQFVAMHGLRQQQAQEDAWKAQQDRDALFALIQTLVLYGIIGLCLILLIWRTFTILKPQVIEIPAEVLAGDADEYAELLEAAASAGELEITKTPTRERVEEFVDTHPEAVANMLRSWLQEEDEIRW